jgi:hypothetical protein
MANYKEVNGICTPYKDMAVPVPGPRDTVDGEIVDGMSLRDGQKGTAGIMAEVGGMSLPDDNTSVGTKLSGIKGSEPRS